MKAKTIVLTMALCFVAAAVCFADDAFTGTWKLNEAKSKLTPGGPKNNLVVYEAAGDNVKITVDGTDSDGKPTHNEWTGKFDGKDYPVTGDPSSDSRSYKMVNDHTLTFTNTKVNWRISRSAPNGAGRSRRHILKIGQSRTWNTAVFCPPCLTFHQEQHRKGASADREQHRERKSA